MKCNVMFVPICCRCVEEGKTREQVLADTIGATKIKQYFKEISGKEDWSLRGWGEWCKPEYFLFGSF